MLSLRHFHWTALDRDDVFYDCDGGLGPGFLRFLLRHVNRRGVYAGGGGRFWSCIGPPPEMLVCPGRSPMTDTLTSIVSRVQTGWEKLPRAFPYQTIPRPWRPPSPFPQDTVSSGIWLNGLTPSRRSLSVGKGHTMSGDGRSGRGSTKGYGSAGNAGVPPALEAFRPEDAVRRRLRVSGSSC